MHIYTDFPYKLPVCIIKFICLSNPLWSYNLQQYPGFMQGKHLKAFSHRQWKQEKENKIFIQSPNVELFGCRDSFVEPKGVV